MQLIIDIPENTYIRIQALVSDDYFEHDICGYSMRRIANGTPLPAEHGELVDRDVINERFDGIWDELHSYSNQPTYKELLDKLSMCLNTADAIIKDNYDEVEEEYGHSN